MELKYKGISREKINEIQKLNMPKFSIPSMKDVDWTQVEISPIQTAIDEMAKKEARNYDIYIICEMSKKFLDIVSTDQDYYKLKYLEENKMRKEDMKDWTRERLETEIMNLSDKNFHLEHRIRQYEESKERLENEREDSKNEISKLEKECLMLRKEIEKHVNKINLLQDELSQMNRNPSCDETQESDCCECWKDKNAISDFETIIIEQQIEIEKLNATIDVLLERIVK